MKQGDADGHDIVDLADSGPSDTVAREEFMRELKTAIKQDYPDLYSKLFMYDIGESENDSEYTDQLSELRSLAFGLDEDDTDYPQVVSRNNDKDNVMQILKKHPAEAKKMQETGDLMSIYDTDLYLDLFEYFSEDMPYGTVHANDGDPVQYISDELDDLGLLESIEEAESVKESDIDQIADVGKVYSKINKMKMDLVDNGMEPEDAQDKACEKYDVDPEMYDKYVEMKRDEREGTKEYKEVDEDLKQRMLELAGLV
jgi:hypothetical protein